MDITRQLILLSDQINVINELLNYQQYDLRRKAAIARKRRNFYKRRAQFLLATLIAQTGNGAESDSKRSIHVSTAR